MRRFQFIILIFLAAIVLNSCKDNPVGVQDNTPMFYAKVVDSDNRPVMNVSMHYILYDFINTQIPLVFDYPLQIPDTITIKIYNSLGKTIATPLNKQFQSPGGHTYLFDASAVTNGVYTCSVTGVTTNKLIRLFAHTYDTTKLKTTAPFIRTDQGGYVAIPISAFGLCQRFIYRYGQYYGQFDIPDSLAIVFVKQGYKDCIQGIKLDTTRAFERIFVLESN
jgi:hypothetical protein